MFFDKVVKLILTGFLLDEAEFYHLHIAIVVEVVVLVPYIGQTTGHTGREITPRRAQDNDPAACHILTAVVSRSLHNSGRARVAHCKAFTRASVDEDLAGSGSVHYCIACNDVLGSFKMGT